MIAIRTLIEKLIILCLEIICTFQTNVLEALYV
jgi:hypothetical protein